MANKRLTIQIDFDGPSPLIPKSTGVIFDRRTSLTNIAKLIRGIDKGAQFRRALPSTIVVQESTVQATGTATPAAVVLNDTLTIGGTALTAKQLRASGTATAATVLAGTTITVNGQVFTGVAGAAVLGEATFSVDTSNTAVAASIAAQVNAYGGAKVKGVVEAKSAAAVVIIYSVMRGTVGNGYTLASSDGTTLAVSGATLANGAATANNQFDFIGTNTETAADIVRAIGASTSAAIKAVSATSASNVVTITSKAPGVAGNAVTLVGGARITASAATLTGGSAGAPIQWQF